jgi:alanine dehydrogenase
MLIGVPKEIKKQEHRVGLVPSSVREFTAHGHKVLMEAGAGAGIGFGDDVYKKAGADIVPTAMEIYSRAEMIVKVKEPQPEECSMLRPGQILFTYLHLAANPALTTALVKSGVIAIGYETVTGADGRGLPLLAPMSEIAGRLSVQVGAHYLQKHLGGLGRLIGGVPGVPPASVLILGGGVSGYNAARMAVGLEAQVTIFDRSLERLRFLDDHFQGRVKTVYSTTDAIERYIKDADIVIGAVLVPGASAPKLVTRSMLKLMKPGAVIVDVAIDQGGCFETSHATTHGDPVYIVDNVIHYCVANMPGAVPLTSALSLNQSVLPYALKLADKGWQRALLADQGFRMGLNICRGQITHQGVADSLQLPFTANPDAFAARPGLN